MPDSVPDMSDTDMMSYMIQVVNSWLCTLTALGFICELEGKMAV